MEQTNQIWEEAMSIIKEEIFDVSYETWFKPILPCGIEGNSFVLQVKDTLAKDILIKKHLPAIRNAIKFVTKTDYDLWQSAFGEYSDVHFRFYDNLNQLFMSGTGKSIPDE